MWTLILPYPPGVEVWIPECNHMGTWMAIKCRLHHYVVEENSVIEVALYDINNHKFKFVGLDMLCDTSDAALALAERIKAKWAEKNNNK